MNNIKNKNLYKLGNILIIISLIVSMFLYFFFFIGFSKRFNSLYSPFIILGVLLLFWFLFLVFYRKTTMLFMMYDFYSSVVFAILSLNIIGIAGIIIIRASINDIFPPQKNEETKKDIVDDITSDTRIKQWIIFGLITLNLILFIIVSGKFYLRLDLTEDAKYSLSKPTLELLNKLEAPLIIEYYYNDSIKEIVQTAKTVQYIEDMLNEYQVASKGKVNLIVKKLNFEKNMAEIRELEDYEGIKPFPLIQSGSTESRSTLGISGIILKYKAGKKVLPMIYNDIGFEFRVDSEIKKLVGADLGTAGIMVGKTDINFQKDYSYLSQLLGKEFSSFTMIESNTPIPDNITILVIIGGTLFTDYDIYSIDQFLMNGGKAFIAANGMEIKSGGGRLVALQSYNKLLDLLEAYGMRIDKNMVGDNDSAKSIPEGPFSSIKYPLWISIKTANFNSKSPIVADINSIDILWASSITIDDKIKDTITPLFNTTKNGWTKSENVNPDPAAYKYPTFSENQQEYTLGYSFDGRLDSYFKDRPLPTKENEAIPDIDKNSKLDSGKAKIIIISSEDFLQTNYVDNNELLLFMNSLSWLSGDLDFIKIRNKGKFTRPLDKAINPAEHEKYKNLTIFFTTFFIPLIFILIGWTIFSLRKSKNYRLKNRFK